MKNLIAILTFFLFFITTYGQSASENDIDVDEKKLQYGLYHALDDYVKVMKKMGFVDKAAKRKYKNSFVDWNEVLVEDFYVAPNVDLHPATVPSDLHPTKLSVSLTSVFSSIKFSYKNVKFYYDAPVKFNSINLSQDALAGNYYAKGFFDSEGKYKNYFYIRTGIEVQQFKGKKRSEEFERTDKVMIHWVFEERNNEQLKNLKIISIHNYGDYPFKNTLPHNPIKPKKNQEFPEEYKEEAITLVTEFVNSYFSAFDTIPEGRDAQNDFLWKYYQSPQTKVAIDITSGEEEKIIAKTYLHRLSILDSLAQEFKLLNIRPEIYYNDKKGEYSMVARTKVNTGFELSDTTNVKNEVLLNMVVSFKFEKGKFSNFKINDIVYKNNNSINSQIVKKEKPVPAVVEGEGTETVVVPKEVRDALDKQAGSVARDFLIKCSQYCRGATINKKDFCALFDDAEMNTIEVINCWTKDTMSFNIAGYLPHLDSLDYASKYFIIVKTDAPSQIQYDSLLNEWFVFIDVEHKFTGFDENKIIKYNDHTVKRVKAIARKEGSEVLVFLKDITIVANECLPFDDKKNARNGVAGNRAK